MLVSICYKSINNSVSIFHSQFVLDMFFFFKSFQSHCFYKVFSYTRFFFSCPGGSFPRGNYVDDKPSERQFSLGEIYRGLIIFGVIFREQLSEEQLSRGQLSGEQFSRRQFSSGAIVWGAIIWGAIFLGGNCLDTALSLFLLLSKLQKLCHFLIKNFILY